MQVKGIFFKKLLVFSESFYFTFQEETTYLIDKKKKHSNFPKCL